MLACPSNLANKKTENMCTSPISHDSGNVSSLIITFFFKWNKIEHANKQLTSKRLFLMVRPGSLALPCLPALPSLPGPCQTGSVGSDRVIFSGDRNVRTQALKCLLGHESAFPEPTGGKSNTQTLLSSSHFTAPFLALRSVTYTTTTARPDAVPTDRHTHTDSRLKLTCLGRSPFQQAGVRVSV